MRRENLTDSVEELREPTPPAPAPQRTKVPASEKGEWRQTAFSITRERHMPAPIRAPPKTKARVPPKEIGAVCSWWNRSEGGSRSLGCRLGVRRRGNVSRCHDRSHVVRLDNRAAVQPVSSARPVYDSLWETGPLVHYLCFVHKPQPSDSHFGKSTSFRQPS